MIAARLPVGILLLGAWLVAGTRMPAQTSAPPGTATVDISTGSTVPLAPGLSGISADLGLPIEYWDYHFNALAKTLGFGWVRFPGGTSSDIYDWQTGEDSQAWYDKFPLESGVGQAPDTIALVAGRGGARLIDAANRANFLGASLVICVNGFTDTAESAGALAAYVKANHIRVAAWELSNEPYLYTDSFFPTATYYLNVMKPFRDAIKAVDPNAIIAIFLTDQARATALSDPWNVAVAAYPDKYWDAITFHDYPATSTGPFSTWMADETANLVNGTATLIQNLVARIGPPGVKVLNTEFDPSLPNGTVPSITDGSVWGGIYAAEYIMRMSTQPALLHVGPSEISYNSGVLASDDHKGEVLARAAEDMPIDTATLNFGFYVSAQGLGLSVLNGVMQNAVRANNTVVSSDSVQVEATGVGPIPALYAMSYTSTQGALSVVLTNKSASPHQVTIRLDRVTLPGPFALQYVTGDASDQNTQINPTAIGVQAGVSGNPVAVPPYSVVRVDLVVPPRAAFMNAASLQPGALAPDTAVAITLPYAVPGASEVAVVGLRGVALVPLQFVTPIRATFTLPPGLDLGPAVAAVLKGAVPVLGGTLDVARVSPGIYSANQNGAGQAAAFWGATDGSGHHAPPTQPTSTCVPNVAVSCLPLPIPAGSVVQLQGTGFRDAQQLEVLVAGTPVQIVSYGSLGLSGGTDQVTILLPGALAGTGQVSVVLVADGVSSNMTTLDIQ